MLALGITPKDFIDTLLTEQSFPQLQEILVDGAALDLNRIDGPIATDADAYYWRLTLNKFVSNVQGFLHGGAAAYIVDTLTSFHMLFVDDRRTHVTINLHMNYIRKIPIGTNVVVKTYIRSRGKRTAMLEAVFVDAADSTIVYLSGQHTKMFYRKPPPSSGKL